MADVAVKGGSGGVATGRVFLTGGSGLVGTAVLNELLARGYEVNALLHRGSLSGSDEHVHIIRGDALDAAAVREGMRGCDAVIHLVGIIMERPRGGVTFERMHVDATRTVVEAAKAGGVRRYVHMSALGTRPDAVSTYHQTKFRAEQLVHDSGLDWTIFRPSIIHGPGGFMRMEARWARYQSPPFFAMPYFGKGFFGFGGSGKLAPIYVGDVAKAFVDALQKPAAIHKSYDLAGPERYTWPEFHRAAARAIVGKPRLTSPMPVWTAKVYAAIGIAPLLGFNRDQVIMSQQDNVADTTAFENDFGWKPRSLRATLPEYVRRL